ncbi:MAG TPA: acyltransferase [Acidobacteriaceae bacterium]
MNPTIDATGDLANLDLLRAVAVGLVFAQHLLQSMGIPVVGDFGHLGVLFFFVHTSLVLMFSMDRLGLSGTSLYRVFSIRRIFRIYPLSIVCVLLVVGFHIPSDFWSSGYVWLGWPAFLSNCFLIQNITHTDSVSIVLWSLPFEVQMYAILPVLFWLTHRFPSLRTVWIVWFAAVAIATAEYILRGRGCDPGWMVTSYIPCFLAGVVAWRLMRGRAPRLHGALWILTLAALVAAYIGVQAYGPRLLGMLDRALRHRSGNWWPIYASMLDDCFFCGITGSLLPLFANVASMWLAALTRQIAKYSYGVYLSHVPILWLCFGVLRIGSPAGSAILALLLTAAVSVVLYYAIEYPAIRFGKHLAMRTIDKTMIETR